MTKCNSSRFFKCSNLIGGKVKKSRKSWFHCYFLNIIPSDVKITWWDRKVPRDKKSCVSILGGHTTKMIEGQLDVLVWRADYLCDRPLWGKDECAG